MSGFFNVWWRVLFVFVLGNSFLAILVILLEWVGIDFYSEWKEACRLGWPIAIVGCTAIALAVYDGQFIDAVKPSHWTNRKQRNIP
jgi:hypothetical protein